MKEYREQTERQVNFEIGGLSVRMTGMQAEIWNAGEATIENMRGAEIHIPVSGEDLSYLRDGEIINRVGLPGPGRYVALSEILSSWETSELRDILEGMPANEA